MRSSRKRPACCSRFKPPIACPYCWRTYAITPWPPFTPDGAARSRASWQKRWAACAWNLARVLTDVLAALGPAIGQCSFEVGPEVAQAFATQFSEAQAWFEGKFEHLSSAGDEPNPLKWLSMTPPGHDPPPSRVQLDLIAANRWQLEDAGVPPTQISAAGLCTACHRELFFSYRREQGRTGRMMSAIGIRA